MVRFKAILEKFGEQGEKTGWTFITVSARNAQKINPGVKKSYKVKGRLDNLVIKGVSLLPMGKGAFIMPVNAQMRKQLKKGEGDEISAQLEKDSSIYKMNAEFIACLADDPEAEIFFNSLAPSHQRYFSKWIDDAKTQTTKTNRIVTAVNALSKGWDYGKMLRNGRDRE